MMEFILKIAIWVGILNVEHELKEINEILSFLQCFHFI